MRPPNSSADLLRAYRSLKPITPEQERTIARMLGFDWQGIASAASPSPTPKPVLPLEPQNGRDDKGSTGRARRKKRFVGLQSVSGLSISAPKTVQKPTLHWLSADKAVEDRPMGKPQIPAALFHPQWTRAILGASLSARSFSGPIDLERTVNLIARGQAISKLPRQPVMTLARGVQALIDVGESMQPFTRDGATLRRDLKRIVGDGTLDILQFVGSPRKSRRDVDAIGWEDYERAFLPQLDACVLIVSDFGVARPLGSTERFNADLWLSVVKRLKQRGHRVVGFIPYRASRWPLRLRRTIEMVTWDRSTTVGRVRFARRGGRSP